MSTTSPVLFLTFNRPDLTEVALRKIVEANPSQIFLFSDGPRPDVPNDNSLVKQTREVLDDLTKSHPQVYKRYMDTNQGLFPAVSGAIDWFFSHVNEGIILEDDCVAHPDFFAYCDELLERYREDQRVWCVSGDNSMSLGVSGSASYGFIRDPLIWGWATWKRAWSHYDRDFALWTEFKGSSREREIIPNRRERAARRELFDFYAGIENWDFKWVLTVLYHGGLTAVPRKNLISNIGMDRPDATHTRGPSKRANFPTTSIVPLVHPAAVRLDPRASRDFVEGRGVGLKKTRVTYQISKKVRRLRRRVGRLLRK